MCAVPFDIKLDLNQIEELFQAPAANPFSTREVEILGQSGMDVLRRHYMRRRQRRELVLEIRLPLEAPAGTNQGLERMTQETRAAVRRFCDGRVEANRNARRLAVKTALRELWIALGVTAVAVALVVAYAAVEPSGLWAFLAGIVTLLSVFAASLAIWDALESLFFDWVPFARESAAYRWIGSLDLHITPQVPETT